MDAAIKSGEVVPWEKNRWTRWKPKSGRRDRCNPYRPPWHRIEGDEEAMKLICLPNDRFMLVAELCVATGWSGDDALLFLYQHEAQRYRFQRHAAMMREAKREIVLMLAKDGANAAS